MLRQMTQEESRGYFVSFMMEQESTSSSAVLSEGYLKQMEAVKNTVIYQIMSNRLGLVPTRNGEEVATFPAVMFLCYLCNGNPGNSVMWAYTLKEMYRLKGQTITLGLLSEQNTFGYGFPNSNGLQDVWDLQKGHMLKRETKKKLAGQDVGNLLDLMFPWTTGLDEQTSESES